ncbi:hypothetical protein RFI_05017, partial [Reticulomyxa filosa]
MMQKKCIPRTISSLDLFKKKKKKKIDFTGWCLTISKSSTNDDDYNNDETQPMFQLYQFVNYSKTMNWCCVHQYLSAAAVGVHRKELMLLPFITKTNKVVLINNWIDYSKIAPLFSNQNKNLDIEN